MTINRKISAYSYFDLAALWKLGEKTEMRAGVNNLLDKSPPIIAADYAPGEGSVTLHLAPADGNTPSVAQRRGNCRPVAPAGASVERGMYRIPLGAQETRVTLSEKP